MSGEYGCQACGGQHPVNWLITRLDPAATISCCEQDISAALVATLAEMMEVDAGWLLEHINTGVDLINPPPEALDDGDGGEHDRDGEAGADGDEDYVAATDE